MKRVAFSLLLVVTILLPSLVVAQIQRAQETEIMQLQKLNRFYRYLNATYVDTLQVESLVETAIKGMLSELDPHSTYLDNEEMKARQSLSMALLVAWVWSIIS